MPAHLQTVLLLQLHRLPAGVRVQDEGAMLQKRLKRLHLFVDRVLIHRFCAACTAPRPARSTPALRPHVPRRRVPEEDQCQPVPDGRVVSLCHLLVHALVYTRARQRLFSDSATPLQILFFLIFFFENSRI